MAWEGVVVAATERNRDRLSAFVGAALALPGVSTPVSAATPLQEYDFQYSHARYDESDNRMRVQVDQLSLAFPLGSRFDARIDATRDIMTGATPVFNRPDADGNPVQVITRATTIHDTRKALAGGLNYYLGDTTVGARVGTSDEDDYDSNYFSLNVRQDLNNRNSTLEAGFSYSDDDVGSALRSDVGGKKRRQEYLLGWTQVLDATSLLQVNLGYTKSEGFLSDPYKRVFISGTGVRADARPEDRDQWAMLGRYKRYLRNLSAAFQFDYRYSTDDWGIQAHTFETSLDKALGRGWHVKPRVRYYSQSDADFYRIYFNAAPGDGLQSSDYRLAAFGALSWDLTVGKSFGSSGVVDAGVEYYDRKYSRRLNGGRGASIENYQFVVYRITLEWKF